MQAALPLYIYPAPGQRDWERAFSAGPAQVSFLIANVHNGPGEGRAEVWSRMLERAEAAGIPVLGYVHTSYAVRPSETVQADIEQWLEFYPTLHGIFIDECTAEEAPVSYYKTIFESVKQRDSRLQVVINPGTVPSEDYMKVCDINAVFESPLKSWKTFQAPEWMRRYPAERFYGIVYGVSEPEMPQVVEQARAAGFGHLFVTGGASPSAALPEWFEASLLAMRNAGQS